MPSRRRVGFDRVRARDFHHLFVPEHIRPRNEHLLEGFLGFAEALGIPKEAHVIEWPIPISEAVIEKVASMVSLDSFVVIHAVASKAERNWLPERYAAVARYLVEKRGLGVVFTGGGGDRERKFVASVGMAAGVPVTNLAGKTTPKEFAALLGRARCVISPDTAAVHIATAMKTPVVGLYAVARPEMTGPYGQLDLCVNAFPETVRDILHKDPVTCAWNTRVPFPEAMAMISVENVIAKIILALRRGEKSRAS
jgi:heptosyltransferase I